MTSPQTDPDIRDISQLHSTNIFSLGAARHKWNGSHDERMVPTRAILPGKRRKTATRPAGSKRWGSEGLRHGPRPDNSIGIMDNRHRMTYHAMVLGATRMEEERIKRI